MGLISFLKEAGEKLLHPGQAKENTEAHAVEPAENKRAKEQVLEQAILDYMAQQDLPVQTVTVAFDSDSGTVNVTGSAPDQKTREKLILCAGNVQGVEHVNDQLTVTASSGVAGEASEWYAVQSGDNLSKIAVKFYGNASKHTAIFEANQPMLSDPDKIYPGQTLRIPR